MFKGGGFRRLEWLAGGRVRGINNKVVWIVPGARPLPAWRMRP